MSKLLILVRHAKSSWSDFSIPDFDRPLNDRGKKDAPVMAGRLLKRDIRIDVLVSSPAKRAKKTAEAFAKVLDIKKEKIQFVEELYLASPETFFKVISGFDDKQESVAVFSHNNGITDFANLLTDTRIDEIPTCGIFAVRAKTKHWRDFPTAEKEWLFFDAPKMNQD